MADQTNDEGKKVDVVAEPLVPPPEMAPAPVAEPAAQPATEPAAELSAEPPASEPAKGDGEGLAPVAQPPEQPQKDVDMAAAGVSASQAAKKHGHSHRNNRQLAAIVTVIIGLIMAGLAVYVYVSASDNTEEIEQKAVPSADNSSSTENSEQNQATLPTEADVDTVEKELDSAIDALSQTEGLSEAELSDETLGL